MIRIILSVAITIILVSMPVSFACAENIYTFSDDDGNVLFTNIVSGNKKPRGIKFRRYEHLEEVTWFPDTNVHKYQNWGDDAFAVSARFAKRRDAYDQLILSESNNNNIDKGLVKAVIHTESGFDPNALSKPGAQGLMQLMPATAARYDVDNAFDPQENIRAGSRHLKYLIDRYRNLELALAAYNAGESNVEKYGGIPPFAETQDYVKRVLHRYNKFYKSSLAVVH